MRHNPSDRWTLSRTRAVLLEVAHKHLPGCRFVVEHPRADLLSVHANPNRWLRVLLRLPVVGPRVRKSLRACAERARDEFMRIKPDNLRVAWHVATRPRPRT